VFPSFDRDSDLDESPTEKRYSSHDENKKLTVNYVSIPSFEM